MQRRLGGGEKAESSKARARTTPATGRADRGVPANAGARVRGAAPGKRRASRSRAKARAPSRSRALAHRAVEHVLSGALLVMAILAALGAPRLDGRPWLLVAVLAGTAVAGLAVAVAIDRVRQRTTPLRRTLLDLALLAGVVALAVWAPPRRTLLRLNEIVAGERATQDRVIRHQVWAAYRRMDKEDERRLMERGEAHAAMVEAAALAFGIDPELLMGVAATESSFLPRDSADGGRGLFQITAVPAAATEEARRVLGVERIDLLDDRQNATVAAATLAGYAAQMKGDLFLTLLAYNIGPANGGLRTVMDQYGARNFAQVQPWLQPLPRDYPVRVLSAALAWRLWRRFHRLPLFEDPEDGRLVQDAGIPGLGDDAWRAGARKPAQASR